jgi:hypothetical protein
MWSAGINVELDAVNENEMERMRGTDGFTGAMFTVLRLADLVPTDNPLRSISGWLNDVLNRMAFLPESSYAT